MKHRGFFVTTFILVYATGVFAQQLRPLTAAEVEYLLLRSVAAKRVTEIVRERGVNFQPSRGLRERFRKAGADDALLAALEIASSKLKNRSKREILELAKDEATVVWYTSLQSPLAEELCKRFNSKRFGITCVVHRSGSGNLYRRLVQEAQSDVTSADVIQTSNIDDFVRLRGEGALLRYRPEGIENFDPSFVEKDGYWAIARAGLFVPAYNTRKISANDVPKSWLDFLDPKFNAAGLAMGDPVSSGFVNVGLATLVSQFGWGFLDKLTARNPRILSSAVDARNQLRSGDTAMLFGGVSYSIYQEVTNGAPIGYIHPKEGVPFVVSPQAVLAHAPHPNAAMVFTDWLFTKEMQQFLADRGHNIGHRGVTYPKDYEQLKAFKFLWPPQEEASALYQRVRDQFR